MCAPASVDSSTSLPHGWGVLSSWSLEHLGSDLTCHFCRWLATMAAEPMLLGSYFDPYYTSCCASFSLTASGCIRPHMQEWHISSLRATNRFACLQFMIPSDLVCFNFNLQLTYVEIQTETSLGMHTLRRVVVGICVCNWGDRLEWSIHATFHCDCLIFWTLLFSFCRFTLHWGVTLAAARAWRRRISCQAVDKTLFVWGGIATGQGQRAGASFHGLLKNA